MSEQRIIKFRGRRKHGKEILIGDLVRTCNGGPCIFPYDDSLGLNSPDYYEVDENTIGQYTGMKDKNGEEIFEGDIVKCFDHPTGVDSATGDVFFNDGCFWVRGSICSLGDFGTAWTEVIGNLYENPELIDTNGQ